MHYAKLLGAGVLAAFLATHASAQAAAPPDPPFSLVPLEDRLTLLGVFGDADPVMKLIMAGLAVAAVAALVVWIVQAVRLRRKGGVGAAGGLAYLSALGGAGPLIGFFGSAYCMLGSFIGLSNVRPAPTLSVMAPGFAEATLSAALGLLAAAIAVIGHRHLKASLYGAAAPSEAPAEESGQAVARQVRLAG